MAASKGIILAGGAGTRLHPLTKGVSKQLMPVYDKPMIYYPLATLMAAGIRDILVINTPHEQAGFQRVLEDGSQWGLTIRYEVQPSPDGIAQAFLIGESFLAGDGAALVLGDNLFFGYGLDDILRRAHARRDGATVFGYYVNDPTAYGVVDFDSSGRVVSLEEKPAAPRSNYAVAGLYFYDNTVVSKAKALKPSSRGELEITDLNRAYLEEGKLQVERLGRGVAWLDTGNPDALLQASNFIQTIQQRQGLRVACVEELSYRYGWIDEERLVRLGKELEKTAYGQYLLSLPSRPPDELATPSDT